MNTCYNPLYLCKHPSEGSHYKLKTSRFKFRQMHSIGVVSCKYMGVWVGCFLLGTFLYSGCFTSGISLGCNYFSTAEKEALFKVVLRLLQTVVQKKHFPIGNQKVANTDLEILRLHSLMTCSLDFLIN